MRPDSITPGSDRPVTSEDTPTLSDTVTGSDATGGLLFSELASRYLANRELIGLKRTTLMDYESYTRVHLVPAFGGLRARGDHDRADRGVHRRQAPGREGGQEHPQLPGAAARDVRVRGQARLVRPQPGRARREAARPTQSGHPLSRRAGARGAVRGDADGRERHNRARPVPDRGDDRSSPRRTARAALAGHRLDRRRGTCPPQLHARPVRHPQVRSLQPRGATRPTRP